jgi:DNA-binding SARP family transcriptional activator
MPKIQLQLIGPARLTIDGHPVEVRPRVAFELLAVILSAGPRGIPRSVVATRLWGHLDAEHAKLQVRVALHRLREELRRLELTGIVDLESRTLRPTQPVELDLDSLRTPRSLLDLKPRPIAEGWEREHWLQEEDRYAMWIADQLVSLGLNQADRETLLEVAELAAATAPANAQLAATILAAFRSRGLLDQANAFVLSFEEAWVERFGAGHIPQLDDAAIFTPVRPKPRWPWLLAIPTLAALVALLGGQLML